jgi:hypothetical protein
MTRVACSHCRRTIPNPFAGLLQWFGDPARPRRLELVHGDGRGCTFRERGLVASGDVERGGSEARRDTWLHTVDTVRVQICGPEGLRLPAEIERRVKALLGSPAPREPAVLCRVPTSWLPPTRGAA